MRKLGRAAIALLLLLLIAGAALLAMAPVDRWRKAAGQSLARGLAQPVDLGRLQWHWLPRPRLVVSAIAVGRGADQQLRADELVLYPDIGALMAGGFGLHSARLQGVSGSLQTLQGLRWHAEQGTGQGGAAGVVPAHIAVHDLRLQPLEAWFGSCQLNMRFTGAEPHDLALRCPRDGVIVTAQAGPVAGDRASQGASGKATVYRISASAERLRVPGLAAPLERFETHGVLRDGTQLTLDRVAASLVGAQVTGNAVLDWAHGWELQGHLTTAEAELPGIVCLFDVNCGGQSAQPPGLASRIHGRVEITTAFNAQAGEAADLLDALSLHGGMVATDFRYDALKLDRFTADYDYRAARLVLPRLAVTAYGGAVTGGAELSWLSGWRLAGSVKIAQLQLEGLLSALAQTPHSGTLEGEMTFRLQGEQARDLFARPELKGDFLVRDGTIRKADLKGAARLVGDHKGQGETPFDRLSGKVEVADGRIELRELTITSSALAASGRLVIDPDGALDGLLEVGVKEPTGLFTVPVRVGGTRDEPALRPSNDALAGAAVGTAVLGPGLGTALGVKAGGLVRKLGGLLPGASRQDTEKNTRERPLTEAPPSPGDQRQGHRAGAP